MAEATEKPAQPASPQSGDVRFSGAGMLEVFDGAEWAPLQGLGAGGIPAIYRGKPQRATTGKTLPDSDDE